MDAVTSDVESHGLNEIFSTKGRQKIKPNFNCEIYYFIIFVFHQNWSQLLIFKFTYYFSKQKFTFVEPYKFAIDFVAK